jgi:hypothetical protein
VLGAVFSLFLLMLTEERSNVTRLNMTQEVAQLHRELRNMSANGASIVVVAGVLDNDVARFRRLDLVGETPVTTELRYIDEDEDNTTISDNRLVMIPDINEPEGMITLVRWISRLAHPDDEDRFLPVFTRSPGFGAPLVVQFRVGDRSAQRPGRSARAQDEEDRRDDAITGPGYQGVVFQAAYGPRNG